MIQFFTNFLPTKIDREKQIQDKMCLTAIKEDIYH